MYCEKRYTNKFDLNFLSANNALQPLFMIQHSQPLLQQPLGSLLLLTYLPKFTYKKIENFASSF